MSSIDLSHYKELYLTTSLEQVGKISEGVTLLQSNPASKEGFDDVYINAHTLVSKSMIMGYTEIGTLSQKIEKLFYGIKQNTTMLSDDLLLAISQAANALKAALQAIQEDSQQVDLSAYKNTLDTFFPRS